MKKNLAIILGAVVWLQGGAATAHALSATGAAIFSDTVGARQLGMADAAAGMIRDANALHVNPAALDQLRQRELTSQYSDDLADTMRESLTLGMPLDGGLFGNRAAWGVGLKAYQGGSMLYTEYDESGGTILSQRTLTAESDYLLSLGYGEALLENLSVGLAVKGVFSTLAETYTAWAVAADLGLLYRTPLSGLQLGISLRDLGTPMTYIETADPLPTCAVAGLGYVFQPHTGIALSLAADYRYAFHTRSSGSIGLEACFLETVFLRCGHFINRDLEGFAAGTGMRWRFLQLDYGIVFMGALSHRQQIALTANF